MKKALGFLLLVSLLPQAALAGQVLEKKSKMLGKNYSIREELGPVLSGSGVQAVTTTQFLGKTVPLVSSTLKYLIEDQKLKEQSNDFYVNGVKIWTGNGSVTSHGASYSGSVSPTQIEMPVFSYTLGPLALEAHGGIEFEASMNAMVDASLEHQNLQANLNTKAHAAGYVEGLVRIILIQVGLGGRANIIDGKAAVSANVPMLEPASASYLYDGKLRVLNGSIYGFIDLKKGKNWKRWKSYNLYSWNGFCWSMGSESCAVLN